MKLALIFLVFSAHSTRAAEAERDDDIPIDILRIGGWSNAKTTIFISFNPRLFWELSGVPL